MMINKNIILKINNAFNNLLILLINYLKIKQKLILYGALMEENLIIFF
jgi:hypothetical protein